MTNKAVRKAVLQIAFFVTLVVTANAIKPFSPGNVVMHTLTAARSFSFALPDAAVERIELANYLAEAYGKSLLDGDLSTPINSSRNTFHSSLTASNPFGVSSEPLEEAEIKDVKSDEAAKKPATRRTLRRLKRDAHDDAAEKSKEIAVLPVVPTAESIAMAKPVRLPAFQPDVIKARAIPASVRWPLPVQSPQCNKAELRVVKLTALIQQLQTLSDQKVAFLLTIKPVAVIPQCHEVKEIVTEEAESAAETTVGPQEEMLFGETFADPMAAPLAPECTRLP